MSTSLKTRVEVRDEMNSKSIKHETPEEAALSMRDLVVRGLPLLAFGLTTLAMVEIRDFSPFVGVAFLALLAVFFTASVRAWLPKPQQ